MLGRVTLDASVKRTHAYLVLLPIEVAAFHPAALIPSDHAPWSHHGGVCKRCIPSRQTRLCGPVPQLDDTDASPRRTAVSRYRTLWSPDLPRNVCTFRDCPACPADRLYAAFAALPETIHAGHPLNCDNGSLTILNMFCNDMK